MSLLRNTGDNSINFQRASCTLDGCVKIWTSRVDSVGTETGKLLSNLANEGRGDGADDDADSDAGDGEGGAKRKKRGEGRPKETLAKSAEQLRSKKLDLEFKVDPLFRKTCADFDEGGAQGLLMNHLSLGVGAEGGMRIVFDASDAMGKGDDEGEAEPEEPEDEIDLSNLRSQFLPNLETLEDKAICHSLADFSFAKGAFAFDESLFARDDSRDDDDDDNGDLGNDFGGAPMDMDAPAEDFFQGDQAVGDDFGGPDVGYGGEDYGEENVSAEGGGGRPGGFVPFDPRRVPNEREIVMAMTQGGEDGMLDYFDQNFLKNWAGPEHWKLRKVVRKREFCTSTLWNRF